MSKNVLINATSKHHVTAEYVFVTSPKNSLQASPSIVICSINSGLQMDLLKTLITEQFDIECTLVKELSEIKTAPSLLIVDCHGRRINMLKDITHTFEDETNNIPAALLNAKYDSEHEALLDWPCMSGIFYDDTTQDQLIKGLRCLLNNDFWVPRRLLHNLINKTRRAPHKISVKGAGITKREKQILIKIKQGATNAVIAKELKVTEHTIKSHLYNLYKKIGVSNRLEASNWVQNVSDDELM